MATDLAVLLRAATPLLIVESTEEREFVDAIRKALGSALRPLYEWTITAGLKRIDIELSGGDLPPGQDSTRVLEAMRSNREPSIYLLLDFAPYLRYAYSARLLKEVLTRAGGGAAHTVILMGTKQELPEDLRALGKPFTPALPTVEEIALLLREAMLDHQRAHFGRRVEVDREVWQPVVRALSGLSRSEVKRIAREVLVADGKIDRDDLRRSIAEKAQLLGQGGRLHLELDTVDFDQVAGLARLKHWLGLRRPVFRGEASHLPPPRGILLLGVQGCGKSLAAKAVAAGFAVPLLRLDIGAMYDKYHGETERNVREAMAQAERLAPCVLWIDEIEKGLSTSDNDGGTSQRLLGFFLTWMAERKAPVFVVATANQIRRLAPELLRKGRFDEIFFIDLPAADVREQLFALHLKGRQCRPDSFDLAALADAAEGFSGAEIEQGVVAALYAAHAAGVYLDTDHVLAELAQTRPLSRIMAEEVEALRAWARERCVPAD